MGRLRAKIKRWYEGKYVTPENDPASSLFRVCGRHEHTLSAKLIRSLIKFHRKEWKCVIPIYLTAIGILIALIALN